MPQLKNPKWEAVAQLTVQGLKHGWTQAEIYQRAGYRARGHSAEHAGSRLLKNVEIQRRIAELQAPAVRKAKLTADTLMQKFERIEAGAVQAEQFGPAGRAAELQGKLAGLMIDRAEVGSPGDFAGIETIADVASAMLQEMDAATALSTLSELMKLIEAQAGQAAVDVTSYRRQDETGLALRALRR